MAKTEKQDRRVRRTERNLRAALHFLIMEKSYDGVTVQDIADRADVGRRFTRILKTKTICI